MNHAASMDDRHIATAMGSKVPPPLISYLIASTRIHTKQFFFRTGPSNFFSSDYAKLNNMYKKMYIWKVLRPTNFKDTEEPPTPRPIHAGDGWKGGEIY